MFNETKNGNTKKPWLEFDSTLWFNIIDYLNNSNRYSNKTKEKLNYLINKKHLLRNLSIAKKLNENKLQYLHRLPSTMITFVSVNATVATKNIIHEEIRNITTSTLVGNSSLSNNSEHKNYLASINCNCNKYFDMPVFDNNLWKITFFILALLILTVSLFLLCSLGLKGLVSKFNNDEFEHNKKRLKRRKSNNTKTFSFSLFEADSLNNKVHSLSNESSKKSCKTIESLKQLFMPDKHLNHDEIYQIAHNENLFGNSNGAFKEREIGFNDNMYSMESMSNNAVFSGFNDAYAHTLSSFKTFKNVPKSINNNKNEDVNISSTNHISDIDFTNNLFEATKAFKHVVRKNSKNVDDQNEKVNFQTSYEFSVPSLQSIPKNEDESKNCHDNDELNLKLKKRRLLIEKTLREASNKDKTNKADCVCPCHKVMKIQNTKSCLKRLSFRKDELLKNSDVIDKSVIKRESIKELMKTKVVSENKQKNQLEDHIYTLVRSRLDHQKEYNDAQNI